MFNFFLNDNALSSISTSNLLLSMLGAVAEFERSIILERQREGIAIAKDQGKYKGRKPSLTEERVQDHCSRADAGEKKTALARQFGISRETVYTYLGAAKTVAFQ